MHRLHCSCFPDRKQLQPASLKVTFPLPCYSPRWFITSSSIRYAARTVNYKTNTCQLQDNTQIAHSCALPNTSFYQRERADKSILAVQFRYFTRSITLSQSLTFRQKGYIKDIERYIETYRDTRTLSPEKIFAEGGTAYATSRSEISCLPALW